MPAQLSGGQQQRVALARAAVYDPPVLLMDEPLGALDKNLREEMQEELRQFHHTVGATILYVTHDQQEAAAMADRIAIMNHGKAEQIGTPHDVYERPANSFVARFLGEANMFRLRSVVPNGAGCLSCETEESLTLLAPDAVSGAMVCVRPEDIAISAEPLRHPAAAFRPDRRYGAGCRHHAPIVLLWAQAARWLYAPVPNAAPPCWASTRRCMWAGMPPICRSCRNDPSSQTGSCKMTSYGLTRRALLAASAAVLAAPAIARAAARASSSGDQRRRDQLRSTTASTSPLPRRPASRSSSR